MRIPVISRYDLNGFSAVDAGEAIPCYRFYDRGIKEVPLIVAI